MPLRVVDGWIGPTKEPDVLISAKTWGDALFEFRRVTPYNLGLALINSGRYDP